MYICFILLNDYHGKELFSTFVKLASLQRLLKQKGVPWVDNSEGRKTVFFFSLKLGWYEWIPAWNFKAAADQWTEESKAPKVLFLMWMYEPFKTLVKDCASLVWACRRATSRKILSEASRKSLEKYSRKVECLFLSLNARPSLSASIKVLHNPLALFGPLRYNSLVRLRLVSLKSCRPRPVNFLSKNIEHMSSSEHDECLLTSATDRLS